MHIQKSYKTSPNNILDQIKKRRETINVTESEYNLPQKYKSPKTEKKQSYFTKQSKAQPKVQKPSKILFTQSKKSQRANSLAPYQTDLTPKKQLFYHIDSSQPKHRPLRKIHSISLVDTPKKLNPKKKTQQNLFTVQEQKNQIGCKKPTSTYKLHSMKVHNSSSKLKIQEKKLHDSTQQKQMSNMHSSKKLYSKNCENYEIYYNEGVNNSSQLRSSKKLNKAAEVSIGLQSSSVLTQEKQKSSRTLRITRNSRSSNHNNVEGNFKKNVSTNHTNSKNNTKSQKGIKSPRVEEFDLNANPSSLSEKKFEKMFLKCSLVLKQYNNEVQRLRGENAELRRENQYLKGAKSYRAL